jgi:hypothetical protein
LIPGLGEIPVGYHVYFPADLQGGTIPSTGDFYREKIKTLVIHPDDPSTAFLKRIYEGTDWTILNTKCSKSFLKQQILNYDRIIMLGHGTEHGLIGNNRMVIDSNLVYLLRSKDCICVWGHADKFAYRYGLTGFYTGMIVSEYDEAIDYGIEPNVQQIEASNILFAESVRNAIGLSPADMVDKIRSEYVLEGNPVVSFNQVNISSSYTKDVHTEHCCQRCGCKYGEEETCSVATHTTYLALIISDMLLRVTSALV